MCLLALVALAAAVAGAACAAALIPTPIGIGPRYRIDAASPAVAHARPVGRFTCSTREVAREVAHLELFADGLVLLIPPGVGMAPPLRLQRLSVTAARCSYAIRTTQPTGVVEFERGRALTLADLFAVWGQPLSRSRIAGFRARPGDEVKAWIDGRRWRGSVGAIPLGQHDEIVVELGGYVPPHRFYGFPRVPADTHGAGRRR